MKHIYRNNYPCCISKAISVLTKSQEFFSSSCIFFSRHLFLIPIQCLYCRHKTPKGLKMKKMILFLSLFLAACTASDTNNKTTPTDFIGQNEDTLLALYGAPDSVYDITPSKYVWAYKNSFFAPKQNPYPNIFSYQGWQGPRYGTPEVRPTYYCTYFFTIENGVVTNYSFNGDDC